MPEVLPINPAINPEIIDHQPLSPGSYVLAAADVQVDSGQGSPTDGHDEAAHRGTESVRDVDVAQGNPELAAANVRDASELHTLLASLPPGTARSTILRRFPELGTEFSVRTAVPLPTSDPTEQHALLQNLLYRATHLVGGHDNAQAVPEYPGVTIDQDLSQLRPVRSDWLEVINDANERGPQMGQVISVKTDRQILEDISAGRASWEDVVYGYQDKDQVEDQKALVAKWHARFRKEPEMPSGHDHSAMSRVIPDARLGHLWRFSAKRTVRMAEIIAAWAERPGGVLQPPRELSLDEQRVTIEQTSAGPVDVRRLNEVFRNPRAKPYIDTILAVYDAADEVIESDRGKALLRDHMRQLNSRHSHQPTQAPYEEFRDLMKQAVSQRVSQIQQSSKLVLPSGFENIYAYL